MCFGAAFRHWWFCFVVLPSESVTAMRPSQEVAAQNVHVLHAFSYEGLSIPLIA